MFKVGLFFKYIKLLEKNYDYIICQTKIQKIVLHVYRIYRIYSCELTLFFYAEHDSHDGGAMVNCCAFTLGLDLK